MVQPPYRPPAWPGLLPARPIYAPAPADVAQAISAALKVDAPVFALANAGGATPTYRIDADEPLFVKLVSPARWTTLKEADAIARWLAAHEAPAIAARHLRPPRLSSGEYVVAYPYAAGRPPHPARDAAVVGRGVGRLHAVLRAHPDAADWQARTGRRLDRLMEVRTAVARGVLDAGPRPDELRRLAADAGISFLPSAHGASAPRPLHGDLNIFNIVIDGDAARFIDFEDAVHSVLPVEHELALVCERVILVQEPDDDAAATAIETLLAAYAGAGGDSCNRAALPDVLIGLSLRSLCTLALIDPLGKDPGEWTKFFALSDAARARREVWA